MEQADRETLGRIDERTRALADWCERHEGQDREDFKEVHHRIGRVERKQNWILGVGSGLAAFGTAVLAWLKSSPSA